MTEPKTETAPRFERVLKRDMIVGGEPKSPGDKVSLTQAQIDRLEVEDYFEPIEQTRTDVKKRGSSK